MCGYVSVAVDDVGEGEDDEKLPLQGQEPSVRFLWGVDAWMEIQAARPWGV